MTEVSSPTCPDPAAALEQQIAAHLAQGRFRKARDDAKLLRKLNGPRGLALLIQANLGLARDMIARGLTADAEQVIQYLATIASPAQLQSLRADLAASTGDFSAAIPGALHLLATATPATPEPDLSRAADQLVVAFAEPAADTPETRAVTLALKAIHDALQAVCESRWDAAHDLLRPIPARSPFRHWKSFLKGLIACHQGDAPRATRCFDSLPPATVPARAAHAWLFLLPPNPTPTQELPPERTVEAACQLLGARGLGRPLLQAEQRWRQSKPGDAYLALRQAAPRFPSDLPDLPGALTDFFCESLTRAEPVCSALERTYGNLLLGPSPPPPLEQALLLRSLVRANAAGLPADILQQDWRTFLESYQRARGPNPRLASLGELWLGRELGTRDHSILPFDPFSSFDPFGPGPRRPRHGLRDADGALAALQRALDLDPQNLEAALALCDLYETLKRTAPRNRLLDTMVARFPNNKGVLLRAARRCLDRKAFTKGLDYLERARALDLLDPAITRESARACFGQAIALFRKNRPDDARAALDRATALAADHATNLASSRWCLLARRAAVEQAAGNPALVAPLLDQAVAAGPSRAAVLLSAHLACFHDLGFQPYQMSRFSQDFEDLSRRTASVRESISLLPVLNFWAPDTRNDKAYQPESQLVEAYLEHAQRHPFTEDDLRQLTRLVPPEDPDVFGIMTLVETWLKRDPKHPAFRLYQLRWEAHGGYNRPPNSANFKKIIEEATRRGDTDTARRARELLDRLPTPPPRPNPRHRKPPPDPDFPPDLPPGFAPDFTAEFPPEPGAGAIDALADLADKLASCSPEELLEARKEALRGGMPPFVFDGIADLATGKIDPSSPPDSPPFTPPSPRPRGRCKTDPKPRPADPNQLDFF